MKLKRNLSELYSSEKGRIMNDFKKPLLILTGPTGVGKTELSINLAKRLNGEIISADSIQVYKYMDIGSAKITAEEMNGVRHYLVDCIDPKDEFNVFVFQKMAKEAMEQIYASGKLPIIVGGTGFYIQSVLYDIDFSEEQGDRAVRIKYEKLLEEKGADYLYELLKQTDPVSAETIHRNNSKKVIRALEYYENTGELMSKHNETERQKESPYNFEYIVLNRERSVLYDRIEQRVDLMLEQGLIDEVKHLLDMGYDKNLVSMQGLGYKEIVDYLNGEYDLDTAVDIIKRDTRHFAKRQLTWFRREKTVRFLNYEDYNNSVNQMTDEIYRLCLEKGMKGQNNE